MHTKGPWAVNDLRVESLNEPGSANDGWVVCDTFGPDAADNAKLIAMAPTLLEHRAQLLAALKDTLLYIAVANHWGQCECYICKINSSSHPSNHR